MLKLDRRTLAQLLQGNQQAIAVFERMLSDVGGALPSTIEEANALAGSALAMAQVAMATVSVLAEALAQLECAPAGVPRVDVDDTAPRAHLGTLAGQDADQVDIAGGAIENTPIGQSKASTAKFTTVAASDQITSTVADGTAPFVVASKTLVSNLHAEQADSLGVATAYPPDAIDLPTVIALANALKAANTAKGV